MNLKDLHELSLRARKAFYDLSVSPLEQRNRAIIFLSELLKEHFDEICAANCEDQRVASEEKLSSPTCVFKNQGA